MPISFRRPVFAGTTLLAPALLLCLLNLSASQAIGQESAPPTALQKQLAKFDLGIVAVGEISTSDSGIEQRDAHVVTTTTVSNAPSPGTSTTTSISSTLLNIKPSSTVGELGTVRYTMKPYLGFEFNFGNLRYTQDYKFTTTTNFTTVNNATNATTTGTSVTNPNFLVGGIQSGVREITFGYIAHLKYRPFGITPYVGAGGGTVRFKPTPGGGQGLPYQYRAAYYYQLGLEDNFPGSPFGMRLGFRQLIYLAPDFLQNYLTITRRTRTSEPTIGFFVRF
jgi:opacity protein-like surface antigen